MHSYSITNDAGDVYVASQLASYSYSMTSYKHIAS